MRILVVGSGGREHAIVRRLTQDEEPHDLHVAPGNHGMDEVATRHPVAADDGDALVDLAIRLEPDLVFVGPEQPLALGLVDRLARARVPVVGPTQRCAQLEASKAFAKAFMERHQIPTARFTTCDSPNRALEAVARFGAPVVVKADGLAAGKGVVVAATLDEAAAAVHAAFAERRFGAAGDVVVVEECLTGIEASFFALCDGQTACFLGSAQDHKRVFDEDRGPNTGGMGAIAPSPLIDAHMRDRVMQSIVRPVVDGMQNDGAPFVGILFVGLMLTSDGPMVIEFNVRLGDPETQAVLPLVGGEFGALLARAATGRLTDAPVEHREGAAVSVVLASGGYPDVFTRGHAIHGIAAAEALDHVHVATAGVARGSRGELITDGGRVLAVVGEGRDLAQARARAYDGVALVRFDGMHFRRDIGARTGAP